ncbi:UDP-N-acetylmuramate dehydrogenase [bacterium]|nr:UDP-N-acetylmuramate dehydrogenase [bacterium]
MKNKALILSALKEANVSFETDVMLSRFTNYGTGGPADLMISPDSPEKTSKALNIMAENNIPVFPIGRGTNLLANDDGFRGALISIANCSVICLGNGKFEAGAQAPLDTLVQISIEKSFADALGLAGIPGSIGGGLAMNAGAWGYSVGEKAYSLSAFDLYGKELSADLAEAFDYRKFSLRGKAVIFSAVFSFNNERDQSELHSEVNQILKKRADSQPLQMQSAGCVFKNPEGDHAGRLIDMAGLKGLSVGGASVSDIHANFIVTQKGARSSDVLELIEKIRNSIYTKFGIKLELEIIKIGFTKQ